MKFKFKNYKRFIELFEREHLKNKNENRKIYS